MVSSEIFRDRGFWSGLQWDICELNCLKWSPVRSLGIEVFELVFSEIFNYLSYEVIFREIFMNWRFQGGLQ